MNGPDDGRRQPREPFQFDLTVALVVMIAVGLILLVTMALWMPHGL